MKKLVTASHTVYARVGHKKFWARW